MTSAEAAAGRGPMRRELPRLPWSAVSRCHPRAATYGVLLVGLWLFGTGEAALINARLGTTPWTVLAQGLAEHSSLSVGGATFAISGVVLLAWIPLGERPGLGTVSNIVVISVAIDVMAPVLASPEQLPARLAEVLLGIGAIGLGSGLFLTAHLGPGRGMVG